MISKKIGPIWFSVKICSSSVVRRAVDQDLALAQLVQRFAVIRHAAVDQFVVGVDGIEQRDLRMRAGRRPCGKCRPLPSAMCWMPSPWYASRYSWIWPDVSEPSSLIGMRILPHGEVIAFDFTPVTLPSMSK